MTDSTSQAAPGTAERPLRVAIIGAGPAGFFAAGALFKQKQVEVSVDLFDRLPAPFGLVRYGVAPDHPEIKRVQDQYEKTAQDHRFRFFGNVDFGKDLLHEDVRRHYDQVIYTVGAQTDRRLGVPGEDLEGSWSATEFVAWYNGHPDYVRRSFDLSHPTAVVIGAGNVAMDVARILAKSVDELATTDIADHALEALRSSGVKDIYVLARRGPVQAKFTTPEIKEFGELAIARPEVRPEDLVLDAASQEELDKDRTAQRNLRVLGEYAERADAGEPRVVRFHFLTAPLELLGDEQGRVRGIRVVRTRIEKSESGYLDAVSTGQEEIIECGLVLRSVGYRGVALGGVPFDERKGLIPNDEGRVRDPKTGAIVPGEYVAGWIKRGPSGVIGTNKGDATKTVEVMLADVATTTPCAEPSPDAVVKLLERRGVRYVRFEDWLKIDAVEKQRGGDTRPRCKICDVAEMLAHVGEPA